jgi:hypothetical protein
MIFGGVFYETELWYLLPLVPAFAVFAHHILSSKLSFAQLCGFGAGEQSTHTHNVDQVHWYGMSALGQANLLHK